MAFPETLITLPHFLAGGVSPSELDDLVEWLNTLAGRVDDSGWLTAAGVITAAGSGGSVSAIGTRAIGSTAAIRGSVTLGTTITVGSDGNTANTQVAQITDSALWPSVTQPITSGAAGPMAVFVIDNTGSIQIVATTPGATLTSPSTVISFGGTYLL